MPIDMLCTDKDKIVDSIKFVITELSNNTNALIEASKILFGLTQGNGTNIIIEILESGMQGANQ